MLGQGIYEKTRKLFIIYGAKYSRIDQVKLVKGSL